MIYSTAEDIDSRTGTRRYLVDEYHIHANAIDQIRISLRETIGKMIRYLNEGIEATRSYWSAELWEIDKTLRSLGIED